MIQNDEYLEAQVMTASPEKLHLMVVDGAIRFAKQAAQAMQEKDFETVHESLNRSRDFVVELTGGLNDEHHVELVEKLKGLFGFVYRNLVDADLEQETKKIATAIEILEMHRETWRMLMNKLQEENRSTVPEPHNQSWEG